MKGRAKKDPTNVDEWLYLANDHQVDARIALKNKRFRNAYMAIGFSVECYVKAAIYKSRRLNRFPDAEDRPDLYTHNLKTLFRELGVDFEGLKGHRVAPNLQALLDWKRGFGYDPGTIPGPYVKDLHEAAFGDNGVIEWLCSTYRLN